MRDLGRWSVVTVVLLSAAGLVLADDLNPPPWRGGDGWTAEFWDFGTDANDDIIADDYYNPYGVPTADITGTWNDMWQGQQGVWLLSGLIDATIPNTPPHPHFPKTIWVQVTWAPEFEGQVPVVKALANPWDPQVISTLVNEMDLVAPWKHSTYEIIEPNNPEWEIVQISGCVGVDELVIDTIPEPVTVVLLGLGAGALFRRRRAG